MLTFSIFNPIDIEHAYAPRVSEVRSISMSMTRALTAILYGFSIQKTADFEDSLWQALAFWRLLDFVWQSNQVLLRQISITCLLSF